MYHDVCSVLKRTNQIGSTKRVVNDEGQSVTMSHSSHTFDIQHIGIGISKRLGINHLRVGTDSIFKCLQFVDIHNGILYTLCLQRVRNQVIGTTIQVVCSHDVVTSLGNVLESIGDGSRTTGNSQTSHTALKRGNAVFEHTLSRVCQATVDVTCIAKTETVGCVLRVTEHVTCSLIDGNCTRVSRGVCLLLSYMELQSLESVISFLCHNSIYLLFIIYYLSFR